MSEGAPVVDVRGMACSDAVVRLHRTLMPLPEGAAVVVRAEAPEVIGDLRRYARRAGHRWGEEAARPGGVTEVEVMRGA